MLSKYTDEIMNFPTLSKEQIINLFKEKNYSLEARNELIIHYMKTVLSLAYEFQGNVDTYEDDLINIGVIGLIEALDSINDGYSLSTEKNIYLGVKRRLCKHLSYLNTLDGNIYLSRYDLLDRCVPFQDELMCDKVRTPEDEVLEKEAIETLINFKKGNVKVLKKEMV